MKFTCVFIVLLTLTTVNCFVQPKTKSEVHVHASPLETKKNVIPDSGMYFSDAPLRDQEGSGDSDDDDLEDNASGKGFDDEDSKDKDKDKDIIDTGSGSGPIGSSNSDDDDLELGSGDDSFPPIHHHVSSTTEPPFKKPDFGSHGRRPDLSSTDKDKDSRIKETSPTTHDGHGDDDDDEDEDDNDRDHHNLVPPVVPPTPSSKHPHSHGHPQAPEVSSRPNVPSISFASTSKPKVFTLDEDEDDENDIDSDGNKLNNEISIMGQKQVTPASFFARPGILAAVIGGAVVGLLCAILLVMFIVYRMKKKDEGSYVLDEPKRPTSNPYARGANKEFYA